MSTHNHEINFKEKFEKEYLEKYREIFEIPKSVEEFLYEEYFTTFKLMPFTRDGGGGSCSCGMQTMGPTTIAFGLCTKNFKSDRESYLSNNFYTYPCEKCGKLFLFASPIYIDIENKVVIARYISNLNILKKDGYKFYEVKEKSGGLEGYIKIIQALEN